MSGKGRFVLDTNAVVSLLAGNRDLAAKLETAEYVGISVKHISNFLPLTACPKATVTVLKGLWVL